MSVSFCGSLPQRAHPARPHPQQRHARNRKHRGQRAQRPVPHLRLRQMEEVEQQRHDQQQPSNHAHGVDALAGLLAVWLIRHLCLGRHRCSLHHSNYRTRITGFASRRAAWPPASSPLPAAGPGALRSAWSSAECRAARWSAGWASARLLLPRSSPCAAACSWHA